MPPTVWSISLGAVREGGEKSFLKIGIVDKGNEFELISSTCGNISHRPGVAEAALLTVL